MKEKLAEEDFGTLPAGELCDIPVQTEFREPESAGYFGNLRVDRVKIVRGQKLLKCAGLLHIRRHFFFRTVRHQAVQLIAAFLHLIEVVEGACQNIFNRHAGRKMGVLIEISGCHMPGPFDCSFIRL